MRCFLALLLDEDVRAHLARTQEDLAEPMDGIRWVKAENLHLTLRFLGERAENELDGLVELLEALPTRKPLELRLCDLGLFGSRNRPRVVYVGLDGQVDRLQELVTEISETAELALDLQAEERAFLPHITLGRVKKTAPGQSERLQSRFLSSSFEPGWALPPLASYCLMRSRLEPTGAVYEQLREFRFEPPA